MYIIGLGVDAIDIAEVVDLLENDCEAFLGNFTLAEQAYAGTGPHKIERLAGRFAAKEAVIKALGVGWGDGIEWTDVEVYNTESGAPAVGLQNRPAQIASELGVTCWLLSLTHTSSVAVAVAVATRTD
jgi:holo-[acyl-carrier protein] synthase